MPIRYFLQMFLPIQYIAIYIALLLKSNLNTLVTPYLYKKQPSPCTTAGFEIQPGVGSSLYVATTYSNYAQIIQGQYTLCTPH